MTFWHSYNRIHSNLYTKLYCSYALCIASYYLYNLLCSSDFINVEWLYRVVAGLNDGMQL